MQVKVVLLEWRSLVISSFKWEYEGKKGKVEAKLVLKEQWSLVIGSCVGMGMLKQNLKQKWS